MKNRFLLVISLLLLSFVHSYAQRSNCGVNPQPNTINQKDGSALTLYPFGTEAVNYLETKNGYTLLFNKTTGNYEYARFNDHGNLDLSGMIASDKVDAVMAKNSDLLPHLKYSKTQENALMQYFQQETQIQQEFGKAGANVFPPNGDRKVLVIMVEYPDLRASIPTSDFELLMNQKNYNNTGSYKDYYESATKNRLHLTSDVYGWFMADSGYKYYGKTSSPNYGSATRKLLISALTDADSAGLDFTQYDNDNDGYVDAVILIHAGQGAEESSAPNSGNYIWSFRSSIGSAPTLDTKKFSAYCMFPEQLYNSGSPIIVGIGVIAHEFGHILDLPDLYSTQYNNSGAGNYTIMAAGTWINYQKTPSYFDAWSKSVLGWTNPILITEVGTYTIPYSVADSNFAFRINTKKANEYFLLENRQRKGFDKYLPSRGLAVWHINTNYAGKLTQLSNNANNDTSHLGTQLLQADGFRELERNVNNGNAGDLFPLLPSKVSITPFTSPSTNLQGTYESTNIYITNITQNPDSSITFRFSSQPAAAFLPDKVSGCAPLTVKLSNNSTAASSFKWNFGNGTSDDNTLNPSIIYDAAGSYTVTLVVYDSVGNAVDSISSNIQVYPTPKVGMNMTQTGNQLVLNNASTGATAIQWQYNIGGTTYSTSNDTVRITVPDTGTVNYKLTVFNNYGCADTVSGFTHAFPTGIKENTGALDKIELYPNPFTSDLKVSFNLRQSARVGFELYNIIGEKAGAVADEFYISGNQTLLLPQFYSIKPGVYFLRIKAGEEIRTMRLIKAE